ncbi:hypothetical protein LIT32_09820 [Bacillus sp. CMF21]|uniref:DUF6884 domain-containing protein n=1 Tax=Metabacillus dongyingensis TaxID=2874282 RepID=UPI001CBF74E6|nr:DUF6884 domain-containing protein [Metabacillus dongyingensis]UAL54058.1 hypothetical protein K8L98_09920 [Metabacillus dongyingensis]USK30375.1 hypothetical protein LIT32_09820 [Bacillus sp. CMF21]
MKQLCVIPCGNKKIWDKEPHLGKVEAQNAYTGTFHLLCRQYAEKFFDDWVILSAKHGFLLPEDFVPGNYNVSFSMKTEEVIRLEELNMQAYEKNLHQFNKFVVLGGKKFRPIIETAVEGEYIYPLQGCTGIGYMQQMLKKAVLTNHSLHD